MIVSRVLFVVCVPYHHTHHTHTNARNNPTPFSFACCVTRALPAFGVSGTLALSFPPQEFPGLLRSSWMSGDSCGAEWALQAYGMLCISPCVWHSGMLRLHLVFRKDTAASCVSDTLPFAFRNAALVFFGSSESYPVFCLSCDFSRWHDVSESFPAFVSFRKASQHSEFRDALFASCVLESSRLVFFCEPPLHGCIPGALSRYLACAAPGPIAFQKVSRPCGVFANVLKLFNV